MNSLDLNGTCTALFFTLNNWTEQDEEVLQGLRTRYLVYGREIAPTTGTRHLQGLVQFPRERKIQPVLAKFGNRLHVEIPISLTASRDYCKKEGDFFERGVLAEKPGQRTDLAAIRNRVMDGATVREILTESDLNYQQLKYAETCRKYVQPKEIHRSIRWYWGESGAGKTRRAVKEAKAMGMEWVVLSGNLNFLNGYDGQELVIIDDFRVKNVELSTLLNMLDRVPLTGNIKGGFAPWNATHIWITCPMHPASLWFPSDAGQVIRRILESPDGRILRLKRKAVIDWTAVADEMARNCEHEGYATESDDE